MRKRASFAKSAVALAFILALLVLLFLYFYFVSPILNGLSKNTNTEQVLRNQV